MDLYQRLGIKRGASEAEVKKAYRSLAKQLHPDRNQDNPKAAERFNQITQAYDILSDKDKRARYDRGELDEGGNPKFGGFGGGGAGGGGGGFGGGGGGGPRPGQSGGFEGFDQAATADLSDLFEGLFAGSRGGRRASPDGFGNRGRVPPQKGGDVQYRLKVPFLDAATLSPQRVTLAAGKAIEVKLPAGVDQGSKIRLAGQGDPGPAGKGDAIIAIEIAAHPHFTREGHDIRLSLPISLNEAVLGAKVKAPTPEGPVMLTVPKGASSGKVLRIKGRGFTDKAGKRGDLLVTLAIDIPVDNAALETFAADWDGGGNPRAGLGV